MASLFGANKLKEIASKIPTDDILDFVEIVKTWHNDYHNGSLKNDKETSREQAYNQDFFIKILGYQEKPSSPYSFEPKATTEKGQLPDAVLSHTDETSSIVNIASVVELKGASTDLDRPQRRDGNMSPVQQGFKYKTQYRNCPFVVVSNFWEFRLYRDNLLDYESWTLDDLIDSTDDYLKFKTWYLLLRRENLTSNSGTSKTEELLSDIRVEQEEIGKKFYTVYKEARLELLRDMYKNNQDVRKNIDTAIEKAQKIIDRIVFVCFAEDKGLLPDNTLNRVLNAADTSAFGGSLWNTLKGFFEAVDTGSEKLDIPDGYNGGLFKHDAKLNSLKINDEPLRMVLSLGSYNFDEDLSVTILGHIFEQSISDLEEIKNKVNESQDITSLATSRRKKDGIFYTPDYIVRYIVDNSLGAYLREHEEKFKKEFKLKGDILDKTYEDRERKVYEKYQTFLQNVKVLDPACGSGAFLVYVFDYLMSENKRVSSILGNNLFSNEDYIRSVLKNNIYGVDLNEESVEITKLSLWLKSAEKGKKLTTLDENIKCGNSLISSPEIAGKKAFDWDEEFSEIMQNGGFDVIVGNPPYLRIQGLREYHPEAVDFFDNNFVSSTGNYDLYSIFTERCWHLLNDDGFLGFIMPHKWLVADSGIGLREFLKKEHSIESICHFDYHMVFPGVSTYTALLFLNKNDKDSFKFMKLKPSELGYKTSQTEISYVDLSNTSSWYLLDSSTREILSKITNSGKKLSKYCDQIYQGLITGRDKIYCFPKDCDIETEVLIPHLRGKDIKRYSELKYSELLLFPYKKTKRGTKLIPEDEMMSRYPKAYAHLLSHKEELSSREKGKFHDAEWYRFSRNQALESFTQTKILTPEIASFPSMTIDTNQYAHNSKVHGIVLNKEVKFDYWSLLALLNSKLFWFFIANRGNVLHGGYYGVKKAHMSPFGVSDSFVTSWKNLSKLSKQTYEQSLLKKLSVGKFEELIQSKYSDIKQIPDKFWETKFNNFVKQLKTEMSLAEQDELFDLHKKYSELISKQSEDISNLEKEIDSEVYELYKLTDDEIKIVER